MAKNTGRGSRVAAEAARNRQAMKPVTADVQRELAEALAEYRWLTDDDRGVLVLALLPTVQALIADAEKRAAAQALRDAADWLDTDPDEGGAPYIADDGSVLFPHRLDIAEVVTWASASLRDRAAALDPSGAADEGAGR